MSRRTSKPGAFARAARADGAGPAARFSSPTSVAVDAAGAVYVADQSNHTTRVIR